MTLVWMEMTWIETTLDQNDHKAIKYLLSVVVFTCYPFRGGVKKEILEVIIKQLIRTWKHFTVCGINGLCKTISEELNKYQKQQY